jgi:hypothetical protein
MNYFCTHSDKNYLEKGLTLYHSLKERTTQNFTLFYLCLDDQTHTTLLQLIASSDLYKNIQPLKLEHIFTPQLLHTVRNLPKSHYGDQYSQFCWALTPYFTNWLLCNKLPENTQLLYCDADIYFYHNPEVIFDVCSKYNIGIHKHRFGGTYNVETNDVGEYNVGCVYFKNNQEARNISTWWKNCLFNPHNQYYKQYGTCGDQKYLDLFIPLFNSNDNENVCVFDEDLKIGHGAPWNFAQYGFPAWGTISYHNQEQPLVFNHFSHFRIIGVKDGVLEWASSLHGEWVPENIDDIVKKYYQHYSKEVSNSIKEIINAQK